MNNESASVFIGASHFLWMSLFALVSAATLVAEGDPGKIWWKAPRGPAYQVLVYSFADSDGDGFGDLRGLEEKLDYLNDGKPDSGGDLGVQALWLSPICPAASYHGYDVIDYKAVSPSLGGMAAFERLSDACRARGIKIILDLPFNHTSSEHPWFKSFLSDPDGKYGSYYGRKREGVKYGAGGKGGFREAQGPDGTVSYFAAFWEGMPDLDCANPAVAAEFEDILAFWMDRGVDGFRFDAVKHVFDPNELPAGTDTVSMTVAFWNRLRAFAKKRNPEVFFLGEVMSDYPSQIAAYAPCMDSLFDFPAAKRLLSAVSGSSAETFVPAYAKALDGYSKSPGFIAAPFISNHDQDRSMSQILSRSGVPGAAGWGPSQRDAPATIASKTVALAKAKVAAAILYTLPGLPFIYYGEELGMTGRSYLGDDIARRAGFPWDEARKSPPFALWGLATGKMEEGQNALTPSAAAQASDRGSLLSHYRSLSALMGTCPALQGGEWKEIGWPGFSEKGMIAYSRSSVGQRLIIIHNLFDGKRSVKAPDGIALEPVFDSSAGGMIAEGKGEKRGEAVIEPFSSAVFTY